MSMLRSVLTYMGLGPDEDYDDGYRYEAGDPVDQRDDEEGREGDETTIDVRQSSDPHLQRSRPGWLEASTTATGGPNRRTISTKDGDPDSGEPPHGRHDVVSGSDPVRSLRAVPPADYNPADDGITVRSVPSDDHSARPGSDRDRSTAGAAPPLRQVKPRALALQSFGEAKILADAFKDSVPVIMNLQGIERDLARRLIDFASGICYALDGSMEKIASQVFLLTPQSVEVPDEDRRRIEQRRYDR